MAFVPYSYDGGQMPPAEYFKLAAAGPISVGQCMAVSGGAAAVSVKPDYICLREDAAAGTDEPVPFMHISEGIVFEAPLAAGAASFAPGTLADVSADGKSIAATTSNKNVMIVSMDGTAAGDICRCRFVG